MDPFDDVVSFSGDGVAVDFDLGDGAEQEKRDALGVEGPNSDRARSRKTSGKRPEREDDEEREEEAKERKNRSLTEKKKQDPTQKLALAAIGAHLSYKSSVQHICAAEGGALLHCRLCGKTFGTRANVWKKHCDGKKHQELLKGKSHKVQSTLQSLASDAQAEQSRQKVEKAEFLHRERVIEAFAESNISFNCIGPLLRELLEEERPNRLSLGHTSHIIRRGIEPVLARLNARISIKWLQAVE